MIFNRICPICGTLFETPIKTKIYCTEKCAKKAYEKRYKEKYGITRFHKYKKGNNWTVLKKAICIKCKCEFFMKSNTKRKYCRVCHPKTGKILGSKHTKESKRKMSQSHKGHSHDLITKWKISNSHMGKMVGSKHPNWRGGKKNNKYCHKFNAEFKDRVRANFDFKCVLCGKSEKDNISKATGKVVKLSIHHVNYNKNACCEDDIQKLFASLCSSCHAKTNYNRERWEKKILKILQKKYNGKCFLHKAETLKAYC